MRRMMLEPIPTNWKKLWDTCDLRSFMLISLSLQTFLIFIAPLRKRTKSNWIMMSLWFAYLLADWAANFAVGLILNSQGDPNGGSHGKKSKNPSQNEDLLAFWASFLLVHLGGPDTITAFALEDNELWPRHLFGLVFQVVAVVYVFILSLPHNRLWIPTILVFLNGMIKYSEKTRALYLASAEKFKSSMLTGANPDINSSKLVDIHNSMSKAKLPAQIDTIPDEDIVTISRKRSFNKTKKGTLTELEVVQYGYQFYQKYIGLIVDMIYGLKERNQSRDFFLNRNGEDAFKVIEVELNLIHEVLFTKLPMVYGKNGAIRRFLSLVTVSLAIVFFLIKSKTNFSEVDVTITYCLLFGALVLDLTALFMILFSDWTIIALRGSPDEEPANTLKNKIIKLFLSLRVEGASKETKSNAKWKEYPPMNRRWSKTISTFNIIHYSLNQGPQLWDQVFQKLGLTRFLYCIIYVKPKSFSKNLRDFIFEELRLKSDYADDLDTAKEINSARGDWVLRAEEGWASLQKYVDDFDYDQSLILWHITTELLYNREEETKDPNHLKLKEISKLLSDYMMYLLYFEPNMMSGVTGIAHIRFLDTFEEVCALVDKIKVDNIEVLQSEISRESSLRQTKACKAILQTSGSNVNSLLFESSNLARKLIEIQEKGSKSEKKIELDKWEIISKVWVEMLCYAAINSRVNTQVAQVSKGGELITIVWLLMVHFGFGDKFQANKRKRVKLYVGK